MTARPHTISPSHSQRSAEYKLLIDCCAGLFLTPASLPLRRRGLTPSYVMGVIWIFVILGIFVLLSGIGWWYHARFFRRYLTNGIVEAEATDESSQNGSSGEYDLDHRMERHWQGAERVVGRARSNAAVMEGN